MLLGCIWEIGLFRVLSLYGINSGGIGLFIGVVFYDFGYGFCKVFPPHWTGDFHVSMVSI